MIKIFDIKDTDISSIIKRDNEFDRSVENIVEDIIKNVRANGDKALFEYCEKFDKAKLSFLEVTSEEIDEAYNSAEPEFIKTLEMAKANIYDYHRRQKRENFVVNEKDGVIMGQRIIPIEKAGLYVPGGTASYPSSVLMNSIPAKIAGVSQLVMVTPPGSDGKIAPAILTAAKVAGVDRIFKVGGAQAIAALAYGTETIPKVDTIVGPGNIFVATAKRMVFGTVNIDMVAGPSEILVIADGKGNASHIAADLLSQAEHDRLSSAILITDSMDFAVKVQNELEVQIPLLPRAEIARTSIDNNGKIIIVKDLAQAVDVSNAIAPEHLEISTDDPFALLNSVKNAGSVFLGRNVPEALGDYFAGPNHTLPTSGTARFSSPLSVDDFIKKSSFIYYTKEALGQVQERIVDFAHREGLDAHANSIAIRFKEQNK
ncbi:MAG: histidinol dehydrogenase [Ruminococcaceae bacterium]|nr:histidinol dehydrogenase [Oscillospiraceae bacterium]